jgi:hypothetical protein
MRHLDIGESPPCTALHKGSIMETKEKDEDCDSEWSDCDEEQLVIGGEEQGQEQEQEEEEDDKSLRIDLESSAIAAINASASATGSGPKKTPKFKVKARAKANARQRSAKMGKKNKRGAMIRKMSSSSSHSAATPVASVSTDRKRKRRQKLLPTESVPQSVFNEADPSLDANIDLSAAKLGLNRTQVKSVLRQVLQSPGARFTNF